jgi:hypothetical protein
MGKAAMTRHVDAHLRGEAGAGARGPGAGRAGPVGLHIVVDCPDAPVFWLHLDAPARATLADLDAFLRRTWLECCGHMSAFEIGGVSYETEPMEAFHPAKGMDVALGEVLAPGVTFSHEYDFGTTTRLRLRTLSEGRGGPYRGKGWRSIRTLARNDPPRPVCAVCGASATRICAQCYGDLGAWVCDACAPDHGCGEEMLLPFVNSPRCGLCGYTGEQW